MSMHWAKPSDGELASSSGTPRSARVTHWLAHRMAITTSTWSKMVRLRRPSGIRCIADPHCPNLESIDEEGGEHQPICRRYMAKPQLLWVCHTVPVEQARLRGRIPISGLEGHGEQGDMEQRGKRTTTRMIRRHPVRALRTAIIRIRIKPRLDIHQNANHVHRAALLVIAMAP